MTDTRKVNAALRKAGLNVEIVRNLTGGSYYYFTDDGQDVVPSIYEYSIRNYTTEQIVKHVRDHLPPRNHRSHMASIPFTSILPTLLHSIQAHDRRQEQRVLAEAAVAPLQVLRDVDGHRHMLRLWKQHVSPTDFTHFTRFLHDIDDGLTHRNGRPPPPPPRDETQEEQVDEDRPNPRTRRPPVEVEEELEDEQQEDENANLELPLRAALAADEPDPTITNVELLPNNLQPLPPVNAPVEETPPAPAATPLLTAVSVTPESPDPKG